MYYHRKLLATFYIIWPEMVSKWFSNYLQLLTDLDWIQNIIKFIKIGVNQITLSIISILEKKVKKRFIKIYIFHQTIFIFTCIVSFNVIESHSYECIIY